jgi:hypothetical protein
MRFARLASKSASRGIRDMAELTKEWLKQTIAEYEANRDELPFGLDTNSAIELQAFKLALASLEADPVAYIFKHPAGKLFWALTDESNKDQSDVIPVYAAPPVPVVPAALPENDDEDGHDIDYLEPSEVYSLGRTAGWNACRAAMLHGAEPVSQTYNLPELIEGMEVSIDVSTCDADLGNRYFGTVTEALELDTAKNGYILLVQDAEPNFDVNGNSPVIPGDVLSAILKVARVRADFDDFDGDRRGIGDCLDEAEQELIVTINKHASQLAAGPIAPNDVREQTAIPPVPGTPDSWISCSDRMPEKGQNVLISVNFDSSLVEPLICSARYTGSTFRRGDATIKPGNGIEQATHWMSLPEPPQEVNRG